MKKIIQIFMRSPRWNRLSPAKRRKILDDYCLVAGKPPLPPLHSTLPQP